MTAKLEETLQLLETGWGDPWSVRGRLVEALRDGDSTLRSRALAFSSEIVDSDQMARLHLAILEEADERPDVRARAAIALGPALELCEYGWWDDPYDPPPLSRAFFEDVQRRLRRLYSSAETPKLVRRRVLESAVRAPRDWQVGAVRAAWNGEDPEWRKTAVFGMGYLGDFAGLLGEALDSEQPEIVAEALHAAAGRNDIEGLEERLLGWADSPQADKSVRLAAIAGLRYVQSSQVHRLLRRLRRHDSEDIARMAVWALEEWEIFNRAPEFEDLEFP